jgi:hypothetical protein
MAKKSAAQPILKPKTSKNSSTTKLSHPSPLSIAIIHPHHPSPSSIIHPHHPSSIIHRPSIFIHY